MRNQEHLTLRRLVSQHTKSDGLLPYQQALSIVHSLILKANKEDLEGQDLVLFNALKEAQFIDANLPPGRGGSRTASGRVAEDGADVFRKLITTDQETVDFMSGLSDGNFSLGIREARRVLQRLLENPDTRDAVQSLLRGNHGR